MEKKEKLYSLGNIFTDMLLAVVAVGIIGITYYGVSGLTPKALTKLLQNEQSVLGVNTNQKDLSYFPANVEKIPFVKDFSLSGNTDADSNAKIRVTYNALEASSYDFIAVTIKNTSVNYQKIEITPSFSLQGSYATVSVTYAGHTSTLVTDKGDTTPVDIVVPPSSSSELKVTIQPTVRLATPVTLELDFVQVAN